MRVLLHPDGKRRVLIVNRGAGRFGYEEQRFSEDEYERCWVPVRQHHLAICDSPETAEREARACIEWLRDVPASR